MESRSIERMGEIMKYTVNAIALLAYLMVAGMFYFIAAIPSLIVMVFWAVIILIGLLFFLILLL